MGKVGLWHHIGVENFALLKLLEKNAKLTYEEYIEFCTENDEYEPCDSSDHNMLGADFMEICHARGFRTKRKYLLDEITRAKRTVEGNAK